MAGDRVPPPWLPPRARSGDFVTCGFVDVS
jgi:hypothetical protein